MANVHMYDVGVKIILNVVTNISTSTLREIKYKKGDGKTYGKWTAVQESVTSISYTTQANDLDMQGTWKLQSYVECPAWEMYGDEVDLVVSSSMRV